MIQFNVLLALLTSVQFTNSEWTSVRERGNCVSRLRRVIGPRLWGGSILAAEKPAHTAKDFWFRVTEGLLAAKIVRIPNPTTPFVVIFNLRTTAAAVSPSLTLDKSHDI
jgi:hypothetical protein